MKYLLFLILLFPVAVSAHPIHVSVCEIKHNTEKDWLEITIKIFADDFTDVLKDRTGIDTRMGSDHEDPATDKLIADYLKEKFKITVNGQRRKLEFASKHVEELAAWCYLVVTDVDKINSITISNTVMMEWFRDQVNVVHLDCNDKLNSTYFSEGRETDTFTFK